tara:strand:- start:2947 stop:3963 length:1017 start_codon:yes stop_codon:yes gene_type:complete
MTKICIFGAGSIGGYIATCLKKTDSEVSLIARGPHKKAIEEKGLTFIKNDKSENFKFNITDDPKKLDIQDYIFISVKAHSISNIVDTLSPMINEQTSIISSVNGLPWWYFYKANTGTNLDDKYIESVDPLGKIWNTFKPERAIGCVVYPACEIIEPGVIKHNEGERISLGEPDGTKSERLKKIANLLIAGGLKVPQKKNLRDEIWIKLWGNCSFNPISALTNTTLDQIGNDKKLLSTVRKLMEECKMVGEKIGVKFNVSIDDRIKGATSIIGHKPSTTQDLNAGKTLEIDPIIGSIIEVGNKLNIETPTLKEINSRLKIKAENLGLYNRSALIDQVTA